MVAARNGSGRKRTLLYVSAYRNISLISFSTKCRLYAYGLHQISIIRTAAARHLRYHQLCCECEWYWYCYYAKGASDIRRVKIIPYHPVINEASGVSHFRVYYSPRLREALSEEPCLASGGIVKAISERRGIIEILRNKPSVYNERHAR